MRLLRRWLGACVLGCLAIAIAAIPACASTPHRLLRPGAYGADVLSLERRLAQLHFHPGSIDGIYETYTTPAVWAFQEVNGLRPTGVVNEATRLALSRPHRIRPLIRDAARTRIEIDLRRQLLFYYRGGRLTLVSHISTGSGRHYCTAGVCGVAVTPIGHFAIFRKVGGWQHSPLGWMYRPMYFDGGFAIHGSMSVPLHPASHGCIRVPMDVGADLPGIVPLGTQVYVLR